MTSSASVSGGPPWPCSAVLAEPPIQPETTQEQGPLSPEGKRAAAAAAAPVDAPSLGPCWPAMQRSQAAAPLQLLPQSRRARQPVVAFPPAVEKPGGLRQGVAVAISSLPFHVHSPRRVVGGIGRRRQRIWNGQRHADGGARNPVPGAVPNAGLPRCVGRLPSIRSHSPGDKRQVLRGHACTVGRGARPGGGGGEWADKMGGCHTGPKPAVPCLWHVDGVHDSRAFPVWGSAIAPWVLSDKFPTPSQINPPRPAQAPGMGSRVQAPETAS